MNKAEQLIACLEGEIAKRDETIARLEPQLNRAIQANYDLRAELSALKAQEPSDHVRALNDALTFGIGMIELNSDGASEHVPAESIYTAPVSEAKAQGDAWAPSVNDYDHSIHSNPDAREWADFFVATFPGLADKHDLMIGWFANAMMAMHDHLARKAQGVVMPDRESNEDGRSHPNSWTDHAIGWNACLRAVARLNAAPVQQVSMPDISRLLEALERVATLHIIPPYTTPQSSQLMMLKGIADQALESYRAAAPSAPAADALVEARKANNELVNDLHVMTNKRRQLVDALTYLRECLDPEDYMGEISMHDFIDDALAAHCAAKGVV